MRNLTKYTTMALSALLLASASFAQTAVGGSGVAMPEIKTSVVKGIVYDANTREALQDVQVTSTFAYGTEITDETGAFQIELREGNAIITATKDGYFVASAEVFGRDNINIYLQRIDMTPATDRYSSIFGELPMSSKVGTANARNIREVSNGATVFSNSLLGISPSVRVINKSGLPGEGSLVNMRGMRTFFSQNTPILVVDGAPIRVDQNLSDVINGFSVDIYDHVNVRDIEQISFVKGADALPFGSLGSNGVIIVETDRGFAGETTVEVRTTQGVSLITRKLPMMNVLEYKSYLSSAAVAKYGDYVQNDFEKNWPFFKPDMTPQERKMYGNDIDWQDNIYSTGFTSDNNFKVKGGDAIVKYMLTAGYQLTNGVVDPTRNSKFYTRANTDISFSEKLTATATFSFSQSDMKLTEQGMVQQTNPLFAAYGFSPLSSAYEYDNKLKRQDIYSQYDSILKISNPEAMKTEVEALAKKIDMAINTNIKYKFRSNLVADLDFGLYFNYLKQDMFAGGQSSRTISPLFVNGTEVLNTVRVGSVQSQSYFGRASLKWNTTLGQKHNLSATGGFQIMSDDQSASNGYGYNTGSDRLRALSNVNKDDRRSGGYANVWRWLNGYVAASYNYDYQLYATLTGTIDATNTYGENSAQAFVFPAVQLGWKLDNAPFLAGSDKISNLMVRAEYSINPNSRYNSTYGRYYYVLEQIRDITGLVRGGIPNTKISPEKVHNFNLGADFSTIGDKFTVSADVYEEYTRDMLLESKISPEYGFNTMFKNDGELRTRGAELSASALIFGKGDVAWRVGANVGHYKTEVRSLGGANEQFMELDNGVTLINRVGETPYSFYGHVSDGVFKDRAEADQFGYMTTVGYNYQAGDIRFRDKDGDRIISDFDREILGDATPDVYGNFYSKLSFKNITLYMNWAYSIGNDIYNGVRRHNESGTVMYNQAKSMVRRWQAEGQVTDIPRVTDVDAGLNNRFSSRWIEDGSYLKLKEVTLSYDMDRKVLFFTGLKIYASAENLFTFTKYSGSDPEFSYSYDGELMGMDLGKIPVPKFVKLGLVMNF